MKKLLIPAISILFLSQCKKSEIPKSTANQVAETTIDNVTQKTYSIETSQTDKIINIFKEQANSSTNYKISTSTPSQVALDSSIWLIEAVLNSEFDKKRITNEVFTDSIFISAPINNNKIDASVLNNTYLTLKNVISQKVSNTNKIEVIDFTAKILNDSIIYRLGLSLFNNINSNNQRSSPCDPFTTETASPQYGTHNTVGNAFTYCSYMPPLDGPSAVMTKLNCAQLNTCALGGYYTNVMAKIFNDIAYVRTIPSADVCLSINSVINATDLNQYKTICQNTGVYQIPSSPPNMTIINYNIVNSQFYILCTGCLNDFHSGWKMTVNYGVYNCSNGSGN